MNDLVKIPGFKVGDSIGMKALEIGAELGQDDYYKDEFGDYQDQEAKVTRVYRPDSGSGPKLWAYELKMPDGKLAKDVYAFAVDNLCYIFYREN